MADRILALDGEGRPIDFGTPQEVERRSAARLRDAGIWLPAAVERRIRDGGKAAPARPPRPEPAAEGSPIITATNLRFGFDRSRARDPRPARPDRCRRARSPRRAEWQRQDHARSPPRGPPAAGHGFRPSPRRRSGRPATRGTRPAGRVRLPGPGAPVPRADRGGGGAPWPPVRAAARGPDPDGAARPPARSLRSAQPVPAVGRGAAAAVTGHRTRARTGGARARRADLRAGPVRLRGPARDPRRAAGGGRHASSPRPTTSVSWRTPRPARSSSTGAGSCPTSGRRDRRPTRGSTSRASRAHSGG